LHCIPVLDGPAPEGTARHQNAQATCLDREPRRTGRYEMVDLPALHGHHDQRGRRWSDRRS